MGKRYCWTRRAELALFQGDPALALDIVKRLIDSAPGLPPGDVITFLWKLKGDALVDLGRAAEAEPLLEAAIDSAMTHRERFLLWRLQASLGKLYHATGRLAEAQRAYSVSDERIEELADTIQDNEYSQLKDSFLQRARSVY